MNQHRKQDNPNIGKYICNIIEKHLALKIQFLGNIAYDDHVHNAVCKKKPLLELSPYTRTALDLRDCFRIIVAAEDFTLGKPHPESFLLALRGLNAALDGTMPKILPDECLVVEDSVGGVEGARAAGMMCLAVANSYPANDLQHANRVVSSLEDVCLDSLQDLTEERA